MTWDAVGALAELVGSLAVLATLGYLTLQVRDARAESRAALLQHRSDAAREMWLARATHPELAGVLETANEKLGSGGPPGTQQLCESTGLDRTQASMVAAFAAAHFFHRQTLFLSPLTKIERETLDGQLTTQFGNGPFRIWFNAIADNEGRGFDPSFVGHVQQLVSERGMTDLHSPANPELKSKRA